MKRIIFIYFRLCYEPHRCDLQIQLRHIWYGTVGTIPSRRQFTLRHRQQVTLKSPIVSIFLALFVASSLLMIIRTTESHD
jgi:hypothetical protein